MKLGQGKPLDRVWIGSMKSAIAIISDKSTKFDSVPLFEPPRARPGLK